MIEFVLVVYMNAQIINQAQRFADIDRCLYFANRISRQASVPLPEKKRGRMTAICKPVTK